MEQYATTYKGPYAPEYLSRVQKRKRQDRKYTLAAKYKARGTLLQKENRIASGAPEKKVIDNSLQTSPLLVTNTVTALNTCVTGDDFTNRDGRKITMKSLKLQACVSSFPGATECGQVRMVVVYDKQTNGAAPSGSDVFASNDALDFNNLNNRERFVTLLSCIVPYQNASSNGSSVIVEKYVKLNLPTIYNATNGGTVADIVSGGLFLLTAARSVPSGGTLPSIVWKARVRFLDD